MIFIFHVKYIGQMYAVPDRRFYNTFKNQKDICL